MHVLVTYDVRTTSPGGVKRLRAVAQACSDFGQRVQFSVFECSVGPVQLVNLKARVLAAVDPSEDSVRFYFLGEDKAPKVEHYGTKKSLDLDGPLIV